LSTVSKTTTILSNSNSHLTALKETANRRYEEGWLEWQWNVE